MEARLGIALLESDNKALASRETNLLGEAHMTMDQVIHRDVLDVTLALLDSHGQRGGTVRLSLTFISVTSEMLSDARARRSLEAKARARAESAQLASQLAEQVAAERSLQSKQDRQRAKRVELEAWVRELVGEVESRTLAATTELQAGLCALEQDVLETRSQAEQRADEQRKQLEDWKEHQQSSRDSEMAQCTAKVEDMMARQCRLSAEQEKDTTQKLEEMNQQLMQMNSDLLEQLAKSEARWLTEVDRRVEVATQALRQELQDSIYADTSTKILQHVDEAISLSESRMISRMDDESRIGNRLTNTTDCNASSSAHAQTSSKPTINPLCQEAPQETNSFETAGGHKPVAEAPDMESEDARTAARRLAKERSLQRKKERMQGEQLLTLPT